MGIERSIPVTISVCQPTESDGPGIGYRLPGYRDPFDPSGRAEPSHGQARRGDIDSAVWIGFESQHSLDVHGRTNAANAGCVRAAHMLFLDGVYIADHQPLVFRRIKTPPPEALDQLVETISQRIGRYLERAGLLVRDVENSYLQWEAVDESVMVDLFGHSITYRTAFGPQAGCKAFTLQTVPAREEDNNNPRLAKANGFSLHTGVAAQAHQRRKRERVVPI